jgi:polar amino acid transport system substrate-binding protein
MKLWTGLLWAAALLGAAAAPACAETRPAFVPADGLHLCVDPGFAPMEFFRNPGDQQPIGFDIELAGALAKSWGVPLKVQTSDFKGLLPAIDSGRCDVAISGMLITPARKEHYAAVPYLATHVVLLAAKNGPALATPEDLSGKVLALEGGSNYENVAAKLNAELKAAGKPAATVQTYPTPTAITQEVMLGRAAAAMTQDVEAAFRLQQFPDKLRVAYTYPDADFFGIYLRKDAAAEKAVREAVAALKADGTLAGIAKHWNIPEANLQDGAS